MRATPVFRAVTVVAASDSDGRNRPLTPSTTCPTNEHDRRSFARWKSASARSRLERSANWLQGPRKERSMADLADQPPQASESPRRPGPRWPSESVIRSRGDALRRSARDRRRRRSWPHRQPCRSARARAPVCASDPPRRAALSASGFCLGQRAPATAGRGSRPRLRLVAVHNARNYRKGGPSGNAIGNRPATFRAA
jgi:hypothetical protein